MRQFAFDIKTNKEFFIEEIGLTYKFKRFSKIGFFYLKTPTTKVITESKGGDVRYIRHTIFGVGYIDSSLLFKGMAFFDFSVRSLIVLVLLAGISYTSGSIYSGAFWAILFYLLITFISWDDDDSILHKARNMYQMQQQ